MFAKPFAMVLALQALTAAPLLAQTPLLSPNMPVDVANGTNASQADWITFGWQSFVAANWPSVVPPTSSGIVGQPNTSTTIGTVSPNGAIVPTTWLTWRTATSTFLPKAPNPGPWNNNPQPLPTGCAAPTSSTPVSPGFQPMRLDMTSKLASPIDELNQASGNPLIDQSGWYVVYDIRIDQSEYTYIQQNQYYDAVAQKNAFPPPPAQPTFVGFPRTGSESMFNPPLPSWAQFGATEIKASWRVLNPSTDQVSRYYTQSGYFIQTDGTCQGPVVFGLIGLHILRLTPSSPSTWFWASFEQVDNVTVPPGATFKPTLALPNTPNGNCPPVPASNSPPPQVTGNILWNNSNPPVNACRVYPISAAVQSANQTWQPALAGTVWANYQMIGVMNPPVPGGPSFPFSFTATNTNMMANMALETYVQTNTGSTTPPYTPGSCMDCHQCGFPQYAPQTSSMYQVFSFLMTNADSSNPSLVKRQGLPQAVLDIMRRAGQRR